MIAPRSIAASLSIVLVFVVFVVDLIIDPWWTTAAVALALSAFCFTANPPRDTDPEWGPRLGMFLLGAGIIEIWHSLPGLAQ